MFHVIDTIIADNAVEDVLAQGHLTEVRAKINKIHGKMGGSTFRDAQSGRNVNSKTTPPVYLEASEAGFPGLEAPVG